MTLTEQITQDWKLALKAGQTIKKDTLSSLRAAIKNAEIERKTTLDNNTVVGIIQKEIKKRNDAADAYKKANRHEQMIQELTEATILESYLPSKISLEEMKSIIDRVILDLNATGIKDMGPVVRESISRLEGKADNKDASLYIREKLS